ncbi:MAG: hypothetical protein SF097_20325 [Acidobacteriota bacterium]|nr:hypothetical protein [Acidobacteriota bacterium]
MLVKSFMLILLLSLSVSEPVGGMFTSHAKHGAQQKKNEPAYSKEQQEKLRQAEKAADHFVLRWRETLDLNILFDELYVTDPDRRQRNIRLYCGECLEEIGKVDADSLKRLSFGFSNMYYLHLEYSLAFDEPENEDLAVPPGFEELEKEMAKIDEIYGETGTQQDQIRQYTLELVRVFDKTSDLFRQHLPAEWFNSIRYKQNYQCEYDENDKSEIFDGDVNSFPTKPGEVIYRVQRGGFDLFFVEEAGEFRVLTIGDEYN